MIEQVIGDGAFYRRGRPAFGEDLLLLLFARVALCTSRLCSCLLLLSLFVLAIQFGALGCRPRFGHLVVRVCRIVMLP